MTTAPEHLEALVSAIRTLLGSGEEIALPEIGRLRVRHLRARTGEDAAGNLVLLPPSNEIQFSTTSAARSAFEKTADDAGLKALINAAKTSREVLVETIGALGKHLTAEGSVLVEGLGEFRRNSQAITFEPAPSLVLAVNKSFAGLPPITTRQERAATIVEPETSSGPPASVATVLDELARGPSDETTSANANAPVDEEPLSVASAEGETAETIVDHVELAATEDAALDNDIDALLASIWPSSGTSSERSTTDAEIASLAGNPEIRSVGAEQSAVPTNVSGDARQRPLAPSAPPPLLRNDGGEFVQARERRRAAFLLVPVALVVGVLAAFVLWQQISGVEPGVAAVEDPDDPASTDTLFAVHAGGTSADAPDSSFDASIFASEQMLADESAPEAEIPPVLPQSAPPPRAQQAPPASEPPPSVGTTEQRIDGSPRQLFGAGEVVPAQGGSTWILASGNRTSAEELASRYRAQGFRSSVLSGEANGIIVFRVAVGQFGNANEARSFRSRLPADAPASAWVLNF